ncbi:MAG: chloride channel protein [Burkholderiaceae bacterium]
MIPPDATPPPQPDVVASMRDALADWRQWVARLVVLAYAAAAGLSVVAFSKLCDLAQVGFKTVLDLHPLTPLVWTTACTAGVVWLTRRFAPGAAGSGIPQVMAALDPNFPPAARSRFVSLRLSLAKMVLTAGSLLGGLASGREGPSVQIAAGVMQHARRWLPAHPGISEHGLLVAGGAAGIAAAFNAPLAGVMFAIEELASKLEQRSSGLIIAAIVLAGLMGVSFFGNATYFGVIDVLSLHYAMWWPASLLVLACGGLGGVFARLLQTSLTGTGDRVSRWRAAHPVAFAAACGFAAGAIGIASHGATFGSGYGYTRSLLQGHVDVPLLYVTLRVVATWLAVWSGVPGGIFAPCLAIGAGVGHDVAVLCGAQADSAALIAIGMAAFLAAVTQAPLTSFIIVMEMVGGHAMVLSLMAAALGASLVSRWIARPLYAALAQAMVSRTRAAPPDASA